MFLKKKERYAGFTLVEIMIVVAIIIVLAAISIPNLLRARHNANEAAAIRTLRTLSTALESYRANQTPPAFPTALSELASTNPQYVNADFVASPKQGYSFSYSEGSSTYSITATPATPGVTGTRTFVVTSDGVITSGGTPIN